MTRFIEVQGNLPLAVGVDALLSLERDEHVFYPRIVLLRTYNEDEEDEYTEQSEVSFLMALSQEDFTGVEVSLFVAMGMALDGANGPRDYGFTAGVIARYFTLYVDQLGSEARLTLHLKVRDRVSREEPAVEVPVNIAKFIDAPESEADYPPPRARA